MSGARALDVLRLAGVFAAGGVVGAGYVLGGCVERHRLLLAPLAAAGLMAAFAWGVRGGGRRRLGRGAVWVAVSLAGLGLVPAVRYGQVVAETRRLMPAGAEVVLRRVDLVVGDRMPDFLVGYATDLSLEEARRVEAGVLKGAGWETADAAPFVTGDVVRSDLSPGYRVHAEHIPAELVEPLLASVDFDAGEARDAAGGRLYWCACDDGGRRVYLWRVPEPW